MTTSKSEHDVLLELESELEHYATQISNGNMKLCASMLLCKLMLDFSLEKIAAYFIVSVEVCYEILDYVVKYGNLGVIKPYAERFQDTLFLEWLNDMSVEDQLNDNNWDLRSSRWIVNVMHGLRDKCVAANVRVIPPFLRLYHICSDTQLAKMFGVTTGVVEHWRSVAILLLEV